MKKFILSLTTTLLFVIYIFFERHSTAAPLPPASLVDTTQSQIPAGNSANPSPNLLTPTPAPAPTTKNLPSPVAPQPQKPSVQNPGAYKDGQYTGPSVDAYYGNVQVQVSVQGGKIANVQFLDYPHDRSTSRFINSQAMPYLTAEAIQAQSAKVDIVSGATDTSMAFQQSLASALGQAKN